MKLSMQVEALPQIILCMYVYIYTYVCLCVCLHVCVCVCIKICHVKVRGRDAQGEWKLFAILWLEAIFLSLLSLSSYYPDNILSTMARKETTDKITATARSPSVAVFLGLKVMFMYVCTLIHRCMDVYCTVDKLRLVVSR